MHGRGDQHRVERGLLGDAGRGGGVDEDERGDDVVADVLRHACAHRDQHVTPVVPEHGDERQLLGLRGTSALRASACASASLKTGDSSTDSRIHRPTITSTPDSRNGIRQPQLPNAASDSTAVSSDSTPVASSCPAGAPVCGHEAQNPRRRASPCSDTSSTAPPHSPPSAKPWTSRSTVSSTGAAVPIGGVRGQQPDREGRPAHQQQAQHQQLLAPDPVAVVPEHQRAQRPGGESDRVRQERQQRADERVGVREEQLVEHERGGGAVEEEVVPLDGGADEAGGDDALEAGGGWGSGRGGGHRHHFLRFGGDGCVSPTVGTRRSEAYVVGHHSSAFEVRVTTMTALPTPLRELRWSPRQALSELHCSGMIWGWGADSRAGLVLTKSPCHHPFSPLPC